jgi:hypothetical protein
MARFAVRRKDFRVHNICYTSLVRISNCSHSFDVELAVNTAPRIMKPKLKVCWVILAAFSPALSSPHGTLPSSLKAVTAFLLGLGEVPVVPKPVWVA